MARLRMMLWALAGLATIAFLALQLTVKTPGPAPSGAAGDIGGPFALTDHTGRAVSEADYAGKYLLIYFGFASCPDVCPLALHVMSAALDEIGAKADRVQPLFITVDPERDTPEALAAYVDFDSRFIGLTGTPEQIEAAARAYKVFYRKAAAQESALGYGVDHSDVIYFMSPDGRLLEPFTHATAAADMAAAMKRRL